jgi:hypothetical protein
MRISLTFTTRVSCSSIIIVLSVYREQFAGISTVFGKLKSASPPVTPHFYPLPASSATKWTNLCCPRQKHVASHVTRDLVSRDAKDFCHGQKHFVSSPFLGGRERERRKGEKTKNSSCLRSIPTMVDHFNYSVIRVIYWD